MKLLLWRKYVHVPPPTLFARRWARPWNIPAGQHLWTVRLEVYEKRRRAARRTLMRFGAYPEIVGFAHFFACHTPAHFARLPGAPLE
jgi:hypothetical protein